jgi:hypothetical protein
MTGVDWFHDVTFLAALMNVIKREPVLSTGNDRELSLGGVGVISALCDKRFETLTNVCFIVPFYKNTASTA